MKTEIRPENEMKDSGIEWVGLIPDDWKIAKNNRLFNISKQLVNENWKNTQLLSLTKGGIIEKNINDGGGKQPESFGTYQCVEKDDIVLCLFDIDVSAVFSDRSKYDGMISPAYRVMKCTDVILPVYAKWWFDAVNTGRYYLIYTKSLRKTIDTDGFGNILTVVPPLPEQQAITDYLDEVCSKIDEIIVEAKASIEEYKELKQAVIVEAVTKGLYKNVEVKETGEKWLHSIPKHWRMEKGKRLLFETNYRSVNGQEELLTVSQYTGITPRSKKNVTMFQAESLVDYKICEVGDIAANTMWMWAGAVGVSRYRGIISPSYNTYRQKRNDYNSDYLDYLLRIAPLVDEYASLSTGIRASRLRLYPTQFLSINYPVPPLVEQIAIVDWLNEQLPKYDSLITEKEALIADLEAYKKSLIYELVTGKRRVV